MQSKPLPIYAIVFWITGLLAGCGKTPGGILPEKDMQAVMTDMLTAEAIIGSDYTAYSNDTLKLAMYESVFRKYGITQAVYDSSLVWYGRNLERYMKIYDRVIAGLDRQIRILGDLPPEVSPEDLIRKDSTDIWPRRPFVTLHPQALFNGITFDLKPPTGFPSGSAFVWGVRIWGLKAGMKSYPELRLRVEQRDTVFAIDRKITEDGYYESVVRTLPARQAERLHGFLWMPVTDSLADYRIYVDSIRLIRYNYNTPFTVHPD
jgi:hypothetical protein